MYKKTFKTYALPMIARSIFSSLMHTADRTIAAIFIGASALVATTLVTPLLYFIYGIAALFIGGLGAYVGLLIGRNDKEKARNTASSILVLLGGIGLVIALPSLFFSKEISIFLGARGAMVTMASTYLRIIALSFPIMLLGRGLDVLIYNDGSPKYSFMLSILATVMNLALNIITVVVLEWGILGLALATVVSEAIIMAGGLYYYVFKARDLKIKRPCINLKTLARIAYNGLSDFVMMFVDAVMIFVLNQAFIKFLSPTHFQGYAAANVLIALFYSIYMGASMGLQPIHSQLMGKKDYVHLKGLLYYSVKKTLGLGLLVYGLSLPLASLVLKLFVNSPQALAHGKFFYATLGFAVMFSNLPLQTSAFFTAINRPMESVLISVARTLVLIPIITYIAIMFMGSMGVALGYLLADVLLTMVLVVYMRRVELSKLKIYN